MGNVNSLLFVVTFYVINNSYVSYYFISSNLQSFSFRCGTESNENLTHSYKFSNLQWPAMMPYR